MKHQDNAHFATPTHARHALLRCRRTALVLATVALAVLAPAASASASKQAIDFFGGEGTLGGQFSSQGAVAVNDSGAGPANPGDVYVIDSASNDSAGNRIERFGRDDNGTPADTADDTYFFISAWGADVSAPPGGSDYEVCTLAADCQPALASPGNGTPAGDGSLSIPKFSPAGIAVDQDTGDVYVSDPGNNRINVYQGDGTFLRSFGFDVDATTPGTGYEVCPATDVCQAGVGGSGVGQIGSPFGGGEGIAVSQPDANPATGTVFLADAVNHRVDTYNLDGSSPASIGSATQFGSRGPNALAVDSRGILYASAERTAAEFLDPRVERYDSQNADGAGVGFLTPILSPADEAQLLTFHATAGQYRLTFGANTTPDLSFDASSEQVRVALEALPSIGAGNVNVQTFRDVDGVLNYTINFTGALAATNLNQLVLSNGSAPLTGTIDVTTVRDGHPGSFPSASVEALAVDPDTDGPGPDTDVLYVQRPGAIQQFGPANPPGLTVPPSAVDDTHGTNGIYNSPRSLAVEPATGRLYVSANGQAGLGVYVLGDSSPTPPTASLDSFSSITTHSATAHATVDPNGPPATRYHFEYSTDGVKWTSTPEVVLGTQETPQPVTETIDPPAFGLSPNTLYHVRLSAARKFATPVTSNELTFTTLPAKPEVETTGTPLRSATTATLLGRIDPRGSATTYHFEYGTEGACDSNPCTAAPDLPAGASQETQFLSQTFENLAPDTTYHYRLIADNAAPGPPVVGADFTVHTRASDAPLSHGHFPGPPGSDRAWEQVSLPDSGGNPVIGAKAFSNGGDRAVYSVAGGTPISDGGNIFGFYGAERPAGAHPQSGWQSELITPPRDQLGGIAWSASLFGAGDLSSLLSINFGSTPAFWRFGPGVQPVKLFEPEPSQSLAVEYWIASADGSRSVAALQGGVLDPAFPAAAVVSNLYDISAGGDPQLISLLPGDALAACGVPDEGALLTKVPKPKTEWLSADGSLVVFPSQGDGPCGSSGAAPFQLYARDIPAHTTTRISPLPLSGPACDATLLRLVPGAVFFSTPSRLAATDSVPANCGGADTDVYRYDLGDDTLACVTCLASIDANVLGSGPQQIAVSADGSHVYFSTQTRLLPGGPPDGKTGVYRVDVQSSDLAYVTAAAGQIGHADGSTYLSPDGSLFYFKGPGTGQFYRYDDIDRSFVCVSCPPDGSAPLGEAFGSNSSSTINTDSLAPDGTFAFTTPNPLVSADQNTVPASPRVGTDAYEWRDGRLLLVTDGLTQWPDSESSAPKIQGISPSGRDLYVVASARYTPDALDDYFRLYDARIGGGIDFPPAKEPCPLEVCQGTPQGAPEEPPPGTSSFLGPGNLEPESTICPRHRVRRHGKCVKRHSKARKHHRRAANHNRRTTR